MFPAPLLLLLPVTGYLSSPLLVLLFGPSSSSPIPVNFTLTSSGQLQAHLSLDLLRYLVPTLIQLVALITLALLCLYLANDLLNNRTTTGRWITSGLFNLGKMSNAEWESQVVLITGGAGALGKEVARMVLEKGAWVVTLDVVALPQTNEQSDKWLHYQCDVSKSAQVERTTELIKEDIRSRSRSRADGQQSSRIPTSPTILINNAGIHSLNSSTSHIITLSSEEVSKVLEVNLLSHFHILRTFLPAILQRDQGGHIISVASSMGHVGVVGMADYVSSKFGVVGLHEVLCRELKAWRGGYADEEFLGTVKAAKLEDDDCEGGQDDEEGAVPIFPSRRQAKAAWKRRVQTTLLIPSHIATPLFPHWVYPWPFSTLTPTMTPTTVAARIVEEIEQRRSGWVYLPRLTWPTGWMAILSDWMRELMFWLSGSDTAVARMRMTAKQMNALSEEDDKMPQRSQASSAVRRRTRQTTNDAVHR